MDVLKKERKNSQSKMKSSDENKKIPTNKKKIMYVTQINRLPFFDKEKGELDFNLLTNTLKENLKIENGYKWAYIVHDLDMQNDMPKPSHIHLIIHNQKGISMKLLKSTLQDDNLSNYEYLHGHFKASEMYIIHDTTKAKEDNKHLYDEHSVIANYDYVSEIKKHRKNRDKAKEKKKKDDYSVLILNGELTMDDFTSYETKEEQERAIYYANNKKQIDDAFAIKAKIDRKKENEKLLGDYPENHQPLEKADDEKHIIWLYGESGTGKSLFSRLLAKLYSEKASEIYFSSSKNDVFQDYNNQRIVVLEELRPNAIDIDDLFKLFDRNINVSMKRRYRNVDVKADVIIINSILSPIEFYARKFDRNCDIKNDNDLDFAIDKADRLGEPAFQLFRRITTTIEVISKNDLSIQMQTMNLQEEKRTVKNYYSDDFDLYVLNHYEYNDDKFIKVEIDDDHKNVKKMYLPFNGITDTDDEFADFWLE